MFSSYQNSSQGNSGFASKVGTNSFDQNIINNQQQQLNSLSSFQKMKIYDQATGKWKEIQNTTGQWNPAYH